MLVRLPICLWKQIMYYLLFGMKIYSFVKLLKKRYIKNLVLDKKFIELQTNQTIFRRLFFCKTVRHSTIIKHNTTEKPYCYANFFSVFSIFHIKFS